MDAIYTALASGGLVAAGIFALWLLPWSDADVEGTSRAFTRVGRRVARRWL